MGFLAITGLGIGGALATSNVAVQNSVPNRVVGTATSTLQFYRFLSGTLGLAVLGSVLNWRFSSRLERTVSDTLRLSFSSDFLDQIKQNLRILVDPTATQALKADFAAKGVGGIEAADQLIAVLHAALVGAVQDVFTASMAVTALALPAALCLNKADSSHETSDGNHSRSPEPWLKA